MWPDSIRHDAVSSLLEAQDAAVVLFTRRDLLGEEGPPSDEVCRLPAPRRMLRTQREDGSWAGPERGNSVYPDNHTDLVATFKQFRLLVERYELTSANIQIARAAEWLFGFQTPDGDIRGFIANQYATYYTGYVLSLLIRASYAQDERIEEGMRWLLAVRQDDGGWSVPILTHHFDGETMRRLTSTYEEPVEADRSQPFSHNWTDMVLRAFAAHPAYRLSGEAIAAGSLLKSRFFQPDVYSSHRAARYWVRFTHWWPNLLTAMESLHTLGFTGNDPDMRRGVDWFLEHQGEDGLWHLSEDREGEASSPRVDNERAWVTLRICRLLDGLAREG